MCTGPQCGAYLHIPLLGAARHGDVRCRCRKRGAAGAFLDQMARGVLHLRDVVCWSYTLMELEEILFRLVSLQTVRWC